MKKRMFLLSLLLLPVIFGLLVSGCAPSKNTSNERVVEMWVMPNSLNPIGDIEALLKPFEEKTGIKVKVTSVDW